jgi:hypothetical protein
MDQPGAGEGAMKKLGVIICAGVLLAVGFFVVTGLWVKSHMETITRKLTGRDIHFAQLAVSYTPIPTIVVTDLALNEGPNSVKIPLLRLYPDLGRIFSGRMNVKKVVLEDPLVVAGGLGSGGPEPAGAKPGGGAPLSISALPEMRMIVNRGKLILQAVRGDRLPVAVTARAEKTGQHLAVQFANASIEEIGLKFAGTVDIESLDPLKLKITAAEGSFNPHAVRDFLLKFGYLTENAAHAIPAIESIIAKKFAVVWDAAAENLRLDAETLDVDQTQLQKVAVNIGDGGAFEVACAQGDVDAGRVFDWLQQNPTGKQALDGALSKIKLKRLTPTGTIQIASLHLQGRRRGSDDGQIGAPSGSLDLTTQGLTLYLVADNGQEQSLTIRQLESKITIEQGKPAIAVNRLTFDSSRGGTGSFTGRVPLPLDVQRTTLKSDLEGLKYFDATIDLHLNKEQPAQAIFDMALDTPGLKVSADGAVFIPGRRQTDLEARLTSLRIFSKPSAARPPPARQKDFLAQPFDVDGVVNRQMSAEAFIKSIQWGASARLQDADIRWNSGAERAVIKAAVRLGGVDLNLGAVGLPPHRWVTTLETRGTDVDLTSLVACFSKELPVFLTGRLFLNGSFTADGDTPQALMDHAQGEATVLITQAAVQRISGLDPRLAFFLDILSTAHINADREDAISINKGVVNANLQEGRLILDKFLLVGPLVHAWGGGEFTIKDKRLKLSGSVRTALGVTSKLDIDRILEKGEGDGSVSF